MLTITIPAVDTFDDDKQEFIVAEATTLELEHSLFSLSKWEEIWEKPFLSHKQHSDEEALSYIKVMTQTPNIAPEVFDRLTQSNLEEINTYINAKMSATWFNEKPGGSRSREIITAEVIYHWLFAARIPKECEHWHLNKLFTTIKVFNENNKPAGKKMSQAEIMARNAKLNAERQAKHNTTG